MDADETNKPLEMEWVREQCRLALAAATETKRPEYWRLQNATARLQVILRRLK